MKFKILALSLVICLCVMLSGCQNNYEDHEKLMESMFVPVEITKYWLVVYQKDTKVMYTVSNATSNIGTFSVLVNPDGSPMVWDDDSNE